ncbi:hypothetical protein GQ53DRAFT_39349 [Thozetella sp. PMI_491]|nr:hypothetical protein GQ53DRAFT_39349 [Thozetella sp. PMI_491]
MCLPPRSSSTATPAFVVSSRPVAPDCVKLHPANCDSLNTAVSPPAKRPPHRSALRLLQLRPIPPRHRHQQNMEARLDTHIFFFIFGLTAGTQVDTAGETTVRLDGRRKKKPHRSRAGHRPACFDRPPLGADPARPRFPSPGHECFSPASRLLSAAPRRMFREIHCTDMDGFF